MSKPNSQNNHGMDLKKENFFFYIIYFVTSNGDYIKVAKNLKAFKKES